MSITVKKCLFCGKNYNGYGATKYCSDECKAEAKKEKQAEWRAKTNYTQRQRDKRRQAKAEELAKFKEKSKKAAEHEAKKRASKEKAFIKKSDNNIKKAAKAGDLFAKMEIIEDSKGQLCLEYWKAYKEYSMQELAEISEDCMQLVNGIPIDIPDFEKEILKSIKECGRIDRNLVHKGKG